jgi:chemotaxis protein MotB
MARKRQEDHANHERWLVSYADFITLLFAFFVVMFASSQADKGKAQQVSDSVKKALEGDKLGARIAAVLGGAVDNQGRGSAQMRGPGGDKHGQIEKGVSEKTASEKKDAKNEEKLAELVPSLEVLSKELKTEIAEGKIQIVMEPRGLVVSFKQAALFPSGEDTIAPDSLPSLDKVAAAIIKIPNPVRLEGHTDSVRINTKRFRSNWDLSTARAIALLDILTMQFHVPEGHISVAGYADTAPIASNDTEEGRSRNRRVDIVILNEQGVLGEPAKPEPAASAPAAATGK